MSTYPILNVRTVEQSNGYVWDTNTLAFVPMTQPGGATGGAGDASAANQTTQIAALGAQADAEATGNGSIIAVLKRIRTLLGGALAVTGTFWQATQPVSLASVPSHAVTNAGTFAVQQARPGTGTRTAVPAAAADTALLAANAARFGATVWNEADKTLYVALGAVAASVTSYTAQVAPGGYFETPFNYTGAVRGIWAANPIGNARVTETT